MLEEVGWNYGMKFKTPQAQEAYAEVLRELGQVIAEVQAQSKVQEARVSMADAPAIALSTAYKVGEMRMKGLEMALRVGTEIDIQWGCLMARLTMEAQDGDR
jgi:hypothetical protein